MFPYQNSFSSIYLAVSNSLFSKEGYIPHFLNFQALRPNSRLCLRTGGLNFSFQQGSEGPQIGAYEKALLDNMIGDQTLFWRSDELELCWGFFEPIFNECVSGDIKPANIHPYEAGSLGPQAAIDRLPAGSWPEKP